MWPFAALSVHDRAGVSGRTKRAKCNRLCTALVLLASCNALAQCPLARPATRACTCESGKRLHAQCRQAVRSVAFGRSAFLLRLCIFVALVHFCCTVGVFGIFCILLCIFVAQRALCGAWSVKYFLLFGFVIVRCFLQPCMLFFAVCGVFCFVIFALLVYFDLFFGDFNSFFLSLFVFYVIFQ